jgi:hypothetical protein
MLVKAIVPIVAVSLFALAGCPGGRAALHVMVEAVAIPAGRPSGPVSLLVRGRSLVAVFSDSEATSLAVCEVPAGPHLPSSVPAPRLVDKVYVSPPPSLWFGEHACAASDGSVSILYLDREREDKSVLKLATGTAEAAGAVGAGQWRLDILEPAGRPVALLALPDGRLASLWATGPLLLRVGSASPETLLEVFQPGSRALAFAAGETRGFTVFDEASRQLLWYSWTAGALSRGVVADAGAVQAPTLDLDGAGAPRLAVASYDSSRRRIYLFQQTQDPQRFTRMTVTMALGTTALFCAPWAGGHLFLYDETRPLGGGKAASDLSLLAPDGVRYRKQIISTGSAPLLSVSAVLVDGVLYVLALRQDLTLMRVDLSSAPQAR